MQLEGEYLPHPEFHLAARYYRSKLGYSVFTPFRLTDGRLVLVSRGWIPAEAKHASIPPAKGPQTILAQIRTSNERNYFTPANQPERNIWFGRDTDAMAAHAQLSLLPLTLDLIGDQNPALLH